jgi:hypothetical protein
VAPRNERIARSSSTIRGLPNVRLSDVHEAERGGRRSSRAVGESEVRGGAATTAASGVPAGDAQECAGKCVAQGWQPSPRKFKLSEEALHHPSHCTGNPAGTNVWPAAQLSPRQLRLYDVDARFFLDQAASGTTARWVVAKVESMPGVVFPGGFHRDPPLAFKVGDFDQEELSCISFSAGCFSRSLPR